MIGGIGMLSAGLLGGPGIGYNQVYLEKQKLEAIDPAAYDRYKANEPTSFLFFPAVAGLDGSKVAILEKDGKPLQEKLDKLAQEGKPLSSDANLEKLNAWWQQAEKYEEQDKGPVKEAQLYRRVALAYTAGVPALMALGYLILIIYFRAQGGYKAEVLTGHAAEDEKFTGGVEGPAEL
jgi:hypothetical protein